MKYRLEGKCNGCDIFSTVFILTLYLILAISGNESVEGWDQWRGDPSHLAETVGPSPINNDIIWEYKTSGLVQSSPVFHEGGLLIGSDDGNLYCIDHESGELNWKFRTDGEVQATALVHNGKAYFGSFDRNLYCINLPHETGSRPDLEWEVQTHGKIIGSCHLSGDSVIFGDNEGYIYSIGPSGRIQWENRISNREIWATPVLNIDNGYGIIGDVGNSIYKFDLERGEEIANLSFSDDSEIYSSGIIYGGTLYITDGEGRKLIAIDCDEWDIKWTFDIGYPAYSTPVIDGERIYFGSFEYLWCLPLEDPDASGEISTDEIIWFSATDDFQGGSSPVVVEDRIYIGSDDYNLYCFFKDNGTMISTTPTRGYIYSSPALWNGSIYFGSNDWSVYCVGDRPPGLVVELALEPEEITSDEVANLTVIVTNEEGISVDGVTLTVETSAGHISMETDGPSVRTIELEGSRGDLIVNPFDVSSRSTMDITIIASRESMRDGSQSIQMIVEPGSSGDEGEVDLSGTFDRTPYYIGVVLVLVVNIMLLSVLVLFKIRDHNTDKEGESR